MTLAATSTPEPASIEATPRDAARAAEQPTHGAFDLRLAMRHAGIRDVRVRWQRVGNAAGPVVVVQGGISADRNASGADGDARGWWRTQVGHGLALDLRRIQVVSIDWLGADGALDAPIDTADQADALAATLDRLGIVRIAAFVGCSYGALAGLQFAARHPARIGRLVAISGAHRPPAYACALRALQRKVVALGQLQCADALGLSLARQFAMLAYRTPEELASRFDGATVLDGVHARCAAEGWLEACGERFVERMTPNAFVRLSESIDLHRVDPAAIAVPTTLVAIEGDRLAPPGDAYAFAETAGAPVRVRVLRSLYGHDAFLKDDARIAVILRAALAGACGGAA